MRIRQLIKALGGQTVLASILGMKVATVGNWSLRDAIPREHHLSVWRVALAKGVAWTPPDAFGTTLVPAPVPANDATKPKAAKKSRKRAGKAQASAAIKPTTSASLSGSRAA
jgi:hypothetical protein